MAANSARPTHVRARTGLAPAQICTGTWGSPLPHPHWDSARPAYGSRWQHLHQDWVHPFHIRTENMAHPWSMFNETGLTPPTSSPGLNRLTSSHFCTGTTRPPTAKRTVQIAPQMASARCMPLRTPNQGRPPVRSLFPAREFHVRSSATIPPLLSASTGSRFESPARAIPHSA